MGILKKVLRAFNKKSYEADLVMAVYVQTSENRGPLVNDFIYAAIKTNCADKSDITIGNTEVGYYLIMVKTTKPMRVLRALINVCSNRYFTRYVYAVRHLNGWVLSAQKSVIGIEVAVDQTKNWVEFWYSSSSAGGEVLSVPKCIRIYPCLSVATDTEDAEVDAECRRYEQLHNGRKPPFFYTLAPESSTVNDTGPEIPEFVRSAQRERKIIEQINRGRSRKKKPTLDMNTFEEGEDLPPH